MTRRPIRACLLIAASVLVPLLSGGVGQAQAQITVTSATPSSAEQGVTVDVEVGGSGFKRGALARFYITGTTDPGGVAVNSTSFSGSGKLVANITVADGAALSQFDIEVTNTDGRTGKGTEKFTVIPKVNGVASCPLPPADYSAPIGGLNRVDASGNPLYGPHLGVGAATRLVEIGGRPVILAAIATPDGTLEIFFLDGDTGAVLDGTVIGSVLQPHVTVAGGGGRFIGFGDFDGNGVPDIVAGAPTRNGVFTTMGARTLSGALTYGAAVGLPFPAVPVGGTGYAVAVGDVDGDGHDEIAAGFMTGGRSIPGRLAVYRRSATAGFEILALVTPSGYSGNDALGTDVSIGDVTGDGLADLVAGASQKTVNRLTMAGEVAVFKQDSGAANGWFADEPSFVLRAAVPRKDDAFGFHTVVADADGDGDEDLLVLTSWGSPDIRGDLVQGPIAGTGNQHTGPLLVGTACSTTPANGCTLSTVRPISGFGGGWATSGASVVDWDTGGTGRAEIYVGAPNASFSSSCGAQPGAAYGYLDGTTRVLFQPADGPGGTYFGWAIAPTAGSPIVLVTAHDQNVGSVTGAGQVWVYKRQP